MAIKTVPLNEALQITGFLLVIHVGQYFETILNEQQLFKMTNVCPLWFLILGVNVIQQHHVFEIEERE